MLLERDTSVKSLEETVARLGKIVADQVDKNQAHINALDEQLYNKSQARETVLESKYVEKATELDSREATLRKTQEGFDARENTAVRRELLGKITKLIQDQKGLTVSSATTTKRIVIHALCIIAMFFGIILAWKFTNLVVKSETIDPEMLIPIGSGVLLFASTLIYYLRWNDSWFREHAHAEFYNRKLNSDILRASWIAELFFEGDKAEGVNLPEPVINSFTRNLFVDNYNSDRKDHPFDDIMSFADKFSKVKVGKFGIEVAANEDAKENKK